MSFTQHYQSNSNQSPHLFKHYFNHYDPVSFPLLTQLRLKIDDHLNKKKYLLAINLLQKAIQIFINNGSEYRYQVLELRKFILKLNYQLKNYKEAIKTLNDIFNFYYTEKEKNITKLIEIKIETAYLFALLKKFDIAIDIFNEVIIELEKNEKILTDPDDLIKLKITLLNFYHDKRDKDNLRKEIIRHYPALLQAPIKYYQQITNLLMFSALLYADHYPSVTLDILLKLKAICERQIEQEKQRLEKEKIEEENIDEDENNLKRRKIMETEEDENNLKKGKIMETEEDKDGDKISEKVIVSSEIITSPISSLSPSNIETEFLKDMESEELRELTEQINSCVFNDFGKYNMFEDISNDVSDEFEDSSINSNDADDESGDVDEFEEFEEILEEGDESAEKNIENSSNQNNFLTLSILHIDLIINKINLVKILNQLEEYPKAILFCQELMQNEINQSTLREKYVPLIQEMLIFALFQAKQFQEIIDHKLLFNRSTKVYYAISLYKLNLFQEFSTYLNFLLALNDPKIKFICAEYYFQTKYYHAAYTLYNQLNQLTDFNHHYKLRIILRLEKCQLLIGDLKTEIMALPSVTFDYLENYTDMDLKILDESKNLFDKRKELGVKMWKKIKYDKTVKNAKIMGNLIAYIILNYPKEVISYIKLSEEIKKWYEAGYEMYEKGITLREAKKNLHIKSRYRSVKWKS